MVTKAFRSLRLLACAGVLLWGAAPVTAQAQGEVVFGCFGGAVEQNYKRFILPSFEAATGTRVRYIPGVSTHVVSQLQAQRGQPEFDLVCIDNGPQSVARELGLLDPILASEVPNFADTIPSARGVDDIGVGYGLLAMGIVYQPEALKKAGIAPPRGWNDLADARFRGQIGMPSITTTPGLFTLTMLSQLNGGSMENMDPGFARMKEVTRNIVAFAPGSEMSQQLQQGEITVSVWTNGETLRFVNRTGFALEFVYPVDGVPIVMPMLNLVKGGPNRVQGRALLNHLISEDVQRILVRESRVGPVNTKVRLNEEEARGIVYGDAVGKLIQPDWSAINHQRAAWTNRWNREIER
jgi:putative spermidine/putrescine transport system substrate-binding protein